MEETQVLGILNGKAQDEVIEVVLQTACGGDRIQLRYREWASGIGWYTQKTIEVTADQVDRLIRILDRTRRRSKSFPQDPISNVVPFAEYGT